ncbi:MAG TPA: lipid IV(A) 3-deoxy-D-manno-octulosonic acid transferase [Steroidobacteraceae bacterium]|nr:lipid IV(A) 3-deoxy-D-manno-octulosonic acid transferase [Steroidobacteraceae bacterium]
MLRLVYSALLYLAAPLALVATALRGLRDPSYRDRLPERLGFTRVRFDVQPIWVHAVSVGEVQAAAPLVRALRSRYPQTPILLTTSTPTGAQRASTLFKDGVRHAYLPYDLPGAARRFLGRTRPVLAIVMEREIWPNLFRACFARRIPILLASARISDRSGRRHRRFAGLFREALACNVTIAAQTQADAERFRAIGISAATVHVTGNIKFDFEVPEEARRAGAHIRSEFAHRAVWVAGSTHEREEDIVLDAHERVRAARSDALLLLVPRHPNRFDAVKSWLRARDVRFVARSAHVAVTADTTVLLVDTLGELLSFYAAANVAFVGGSLVPIGGHNLLEPAALNRPIIVGPHTFNAADVAQMFLEAGAAVQVESATQLSAAVLELLTSAARRDEMIAKAHAILQQNRGALARVLALVEELLRR